jgi:Rieske Fe-S protein
MSLPRTTSRRTALTGIVTAGIGVPLLAACGSDDGATTSTASDAPTAAGSSGASASEPAAGGGASGIASTSDIEVGGGTIFADEEVVITQPTAGEFKCFSSICTHQGCPVTKVEDGSIDCTCHGSKFSIEDGSPTEGPADEPLAEKQITVTGDQISLA